MAVRCGWGSHESASFFFSFEKLRVGGFIGRPCICSTRCHVLYTAACQIIVHIHVHVPISTALYVEMSLSDCIRLYYYSRILKS